MPLPSPTRATCLAHLILLDFIIRTILGEEYRKISSSLCSSLHSLVTSILLDPNILFNTLFGCPLLLIQYIRSYPPYWRSFLHPRTEDAPCRGDRNPLITWNNNNNNNNSSVNIYNWPVYFTNFTPKSVPFQPSVHRIYK